MMLIPISYPFLTPFETCCIEPLRFRSFDAVRCVSRILHRSQLFIDVCAIGVEHALMPVLLPGCQTLDCRKKWETHATLRCVCSLVPSEFAGSSLKLTFPGLSASSRHTFDSCPQYSLLEARRLSYKSPHTDQGLEVSGLWLVVRMPPVWATSMCS